MYKAETDKLLAQRDQLEAARGEDARLLAEARQGIEALSAERDAATQRARAAEGSLALQLDLTAQQDAKIRELEEHAHLLRLDNARLLRWYLPARFRRK